jgi:hypothetical protein
MPINILDAPVPGQSLTLPKGATPMEQPPRFVKLDEALDFVFDRLTEPKQLTKMILLLKNGSSCEYLARTILFAGGMNAMWNVDLMMLMADKVMYMIAALGQVKGVKNLKVKSVDKEYNKFLDTFAKMTPEEAKVEEQVTESIFSGLGKE